MKQTIFLLSVVTVLFIFVGVVLYTIAVQNHEDAHKQFAIYNGCNEYEINYFFNPHFTCLNRTRNLTPVEKNTEYILDGMNEIIAYNTSVVWIAMVSVGFLVCITMILIYHSWKVNR